MESSFVESIIEFGILGLKEKDFLLAIDANHEEYFWVAKMLSKEGVHIGYFCMFSNDDYEYHLQNSKGTVRIFKTIEAASKIYSDFTYTNGTCIPYVHLGLV